MRNGIFASTFLLLSAVGAAPGQSVMPASSVASTRPAAPAQLGSPETPRSGVLEERNSTDNNSLTPLQFWASAEYLMWWMKGGSVPPLVTTGTPATAGILGGPGTGILSGGDQSNRRPFSGARFSVGYWCNDCQSIGIGADYFFLGQRSSPFGANSSGAPGTVVLSRPFFNVLTGLPDVQLVALPGVAGGAVQTSLASSLQGAAANLFLNVCYQPACQSQCCSTDCCKPDCGGGTSYSLDMFAGPRWLQLNEDLVITEQVTDLGTGTLFTITDRFETRNNFYGGQIGARAGWQKGRCFLNVLGSLAVGITHQEVRISGSTVITGPGVVPSVQQGGLLALPTNIGTYSRDRFSVVPEIGFNVGCQVTERVRLFAGYTFLYWSNVVRPGDQIDLGINPTQLPTAAGPGVLVGPARPAFEFRETSFWAQGINIGAQLNW